jgi:hypothetical protein
MPFGHKDGKGERSQWTEGTEIGRTGSDLDLQLAGQTDPDALRHLRLDAVDPATDRAATRPVTVEASGRSGRRAGSAVDSSPVEELSTSRARTGFSHPREIKLSWPSS